MKLVVELGLKLDKDYNYYDEMLRNHGFKKIKKVITKDIYYTNKNLDGLSENEMKNACVRFRTYHIIERNEIKEDTFVFQLQNFTIFDNKYEKSKKCDKEDFKEYEKLLTSNGWNKIFDIEKTDTQYKNDSIDSMIQLQSTTGLRLLVYYDNPKYYDINLEKQRRLLIDELNSYGFNFDYNILGLDRLRTLYYKKEMYSKNQNA